MKNLLGSILFIAICIGFVISILNGVNRFSGEFKKDQNNYKELLGVRVKINKDTLTIVDYNSFLSTLQLNNGTSISLDYLNEKTIIE